MKTQLDLSSAAQRAVKDLIDHDLIMLVTHEDTGVTSVMLTDKGLSVADMLFCDVGGTVKEDKEAAKFSMNAKKYLDSLFEK